MEVTKVAFLLLFLGVVNAEVCERKGEEIHTCTQCMWMSQDPIEGNRCQFCEDDEQKPGEAGLVKGCIKAKDSCGQPKQLPDSNIDKTEDQQIDASLDGQKIQPQAAKIKVIPGVEKTIDFKVTLGDAPVDIYFLFDSSNSMNDLQKRLKASANEIIENVRNLTENAQFGIGGYTDKPIVPFANEPTITGPADHKKVFAFQHHLTITNDYPALKTAIENIELAKNVDDPEANFDALAQAMLCEDIVGWRGDDIRKVIIMIGDEESKYAMDGMIAGIVKPFDMRCHTELADYYGKNVVHYTKQLELDFPSFGQIRKLKRETKTDIIFLTKKTKLQWFKDASKIIQDTDKNVAAFDEENSDVTEIIRKQYESIKSRVMVTSSIPTALQGNLEVTFDVSGSGCNLINDQAQVQCDNVQSGTKIALKAKVKVKQDYCFSGNFGEPITIQVQNQKNGQLTVRVECEKCENCDPPESKPKHESCNKNGTLTCGACECDDGWSGRQCKCNLSDKASSNDNCDEEDTCNGQGTCQCGKCKCNENFLGTHCKCSKAECPGYDHTTGQVCSGHGECNKCDEESMATECTCNNGREGEDCSCSTEKEPCKDKKTGQVCMGNGQCECNNGQRCKCNEGYSGKYCQRQQGDHNYCKPILPCVIKKAYQNTGNDLSDYEAECNKNSKPNGQTKPIFGANIKIACDLKDLDNAKFDGAEFLKQWKKDNNKTVEFLISNDLDCKEAIEEFQKEQEQQNGTRGDLEMKDKRFENLETCRTKDPSIGCYFLFYHSKIGSDDFFSSEPSTNDEIYVVFQYAEDDKKWVPQSECSQIPIEQLMGISGGVALAILIVVITTAYLIMYYRDRKRWLEFQAERKENEKRFGENFNPLFGKNLDNL